MPVYEYKCNDCGKKYEIYHKSINKLSDIECPSCKSRNYKKLLSSFSTSNESDSYETSTGCADGSCNLPAYGGCSTGSCGLN
ncbi:FmdB family zinc ribbon protein [Melioribacter sp. OK-6-Me]|uniref:FmdB family zinc ribbon protein n=1 Tax=unclassified Melioribacter TaxID=2627329 RepID=UPI003EDB3C44